MKAMILAAGRGERLRPLTETIPKPLLAISGEALVVHQIRWLRRAGIRDVVINLHHLGDRIEAALGNGADLGVRIQYSREAGLLGTGGGIDKALPLLAAGEPAAGAPPFLLLNGDIWTNYPFHNLLGAQPDAAHLVLTPVPPNRCRGDFHLDAGRVRRGGRDDLTYCGIAVLNPALFAACPGPPFSLRDLLFQAAAEGTLTGEVFHGVWIDVGTPDQLKRARRPSSSL